MKNSSRKCAVEAERERSETTDDPAAVLRDLVSEWEEAAADQERLAAAAETDEDERRHRGRREALEQGIKRLESSDLADDPYRAVEHASDRLGERSRELSRLIEEETPLESKHRAMREEMERMTDRLEGARTRLGEVLDEDELPDGRERTDERRDRAEDDHLEDVEDGCGCTEIWEHLADRRASEQ